CASSYYGYDGFAYW
nr:immunoglobulin heavy chain junction region [Mus musculus]MBK4195423.1 immunoglobulin heavy chain junction region [Mus musculus]